MTRDEIARLIDAERARADAKPTPRAYTAEAAERRKALGTIRARERRAVRSARFLAAEGMKTCAACLERKSTDHFLSNRKFADRLGVHCHVCRLAKQSTPRYQRERQKRMDEYNPGVRWANGMRLKYGISEREFEAMAEAQNYGCAICGAKTCDAAHSLLAVDHCHSTGKVRGLLCSQCNHGLGNFRDNVQLIARAMAYLVGSSGVDLAARTANNKFIADMRLRKEAKQNGSRGQALP